jgi:hypothetical protein
VNFTCFPMFSLQGFGGTVSRTSKFCSLIPNVDLASHRPVITLLHSQKLSIYIGHFHLSERYLRDNLDLKEISIWTS